MHGGYARLLLLAMGGSCGRTDGQELGVNVALTRTRPPTPRTPGIAFVIVAPLKNSPPFSGFRLTQNLVFRVFGRVCWVMEIRQSSDAAVAVRDPWIKLYDAKVRVSNIDHIVRSSEFDQGAQDWGCWVVTKGGQRLRTWWRFGSAERELEALIEAASGPSSNC